MHRHRGARARGRAHVHQHVHHLHLARRETVGSVVIVASMRSTGIAAKRVLPAATASGVYCVASPPPFVTRNEARTQGPLTPMRLSDLWGMRSDVDPGPRDPTERDGGILSLTPEVIFPDCAIHAGRETRAGHGADNGGGRRDRLNRV